MGVGHAGGRNGPSSWGTGPAFWGRRETLHKPAETMIFRWWLEEKKRLATDKNNH